MCVCVCAHAVPLTVVAVSQEHVAVFLCRREGGGILGGGLPIVRHGTGGEREEILRPETARLITQLE